MAARYSACLSSALIGITYNFLLAMFILPCRAWISYYRCMPFPIGTWMRPPRQLVVAITLALAFPAASLAQVRVLMSGGFSAAYHELLPQFENTTGITVTTATGASQGNGPETIRAQLRRGVPADMVIMSREGLAELLAEDIIALGSDVDLGRVPLGVGVRAGTSRPNIGTVYAFKQTLLRAKSIGIQSSSAIYLRTKVFSQLGIASALEGKLSNAGAASLARGEAEMIVLPVSEILPYPGVDFVGTIPAELQFVQVFAAAVITRCEGSGSSQKAHCFPRIGQGNSFGRENGDETDASALSSTNFRSRRRERSPSPDQNPGRCAAGRTRCRTVRCRGLQSRHRSFCERSRLVFAMPGNYLPPEWRSPRRSARQPSAQSTSSWHH